MHWQMSAVLALQLVELLLLQISSGVQTAMPLQSHMLARQQQQQQ
jgi:hypothetical protein